jgi:S1-C subfamily serine protease
MRYITLSILLAAAAACSSNEPSAREPERPAAVESAPKPPPAPAAEGKAVETARGDKPAAGAPARTTSPVQAEDLDASPGLNFMPNYGSDVEGCEIEMARPGGAADKAGLRAGDVIIKLADHDVASVADYQEALGYVKIGQQVAITYKRSGEVKTTTATMGRSAR